MRIKKNVIQLTLMIAGFLLLIHAVLPHTHHDGIICFTENTSHCDDHSTDLSHQTNHHHEHHDSDDCDLKENIVRQVDSGDNTVFDFAAHFLSLCYLGYHQSASHLDPPDLRFSIRQKPYLESYISPCVVSVKTLRAPPAFLLS